MGVMDGCTDFEAVESLSASYSKKALELWSTQIVKILLIWCKSLHFDMTTVKLLFSVLLYDLIVCVRLYVSVCEEPSFMYFVLTPVSSAPTSCEESFSSQSQLFCETRSKHEHCPRAVSYLVFYSNQSRP